MTRPIVFLCAFALSAAGCASSREEQREIVKKEESATELFAAGQAAAATGDMTRAEQYLVAALRAGGPEKKITQQLLQVCVSDQRYPVALEYVEQYLHRHPQDTDLLFAAGSLHAAVGDIEGARTRLLQVTMQRPDWAEPHYALATVLREDGYDLPRADEQDLAYLRLAPKGSLVETARARLSQGRQ